MSNYTDWVAFYHPRKVLVRLRLIGDLVAAARQVSHEEGWEAKLTHQTNGYLRLSVGPR